MATSVIHQDLAHELSCDGKKMRSALPLGKILPDHSKISLIHQGCALQSVLLTLVPQVTAGQTAQFVIHEWQERVQGLAVALPPALQQRCDLTRRPMSHRFAPLEALGWVAYPFAFRLSNIGKARAVPLLRAYFSADDQIRQYFSPLLIEGFFDGHF